MIFNVWHGPQLLGVVNARNKGDAELEARQRYGTTRLPDGTPVDRKLYVTLGETQRGAGAKAPTFQPSPRPT